MSHFTTVRTKIRDAEALKAALAELGYPCEEGSNLPLYGYMGDLRPEKGDIVVRRQHIGPLSNDIGFRKVGDSYEMIISEYDSETGRGKDVMMRVEQVVARVRQQYAYEKVKGELQRRQWSVLSEETLPDQTIKVVVRAWH